MLSSVCRPSINESRSVDSLDRFHPMFLGGVVVGTGTGCPS